jgi:hypothetical protein
MFAGAARPEEPMPNYQRLATVPTVARGYTDLEALQVVLLRRNASLGPVRNGHARFLDLLVEITLGTTVSGGQLLRVVVSALPHATELGRLNDGVVVSVLGLSLDSLARLVQGALNEELKNVDGATELGRDLGVSASLSQRGKRENKPSHSCCGSTSRDHKHRCCHHPCACRTGRGEAP